MSPTVKGITRAIAHDISDGRAASFNQVATNLEISKIELKNNKQNVKRKKLSGFHEKLEQILIEHRKGINLYFIKIAYIEPKININKFRKHHLPISNVKLVTPKPKVATDALYTPKIKRKKI